MPGWETGTGDIIEEMPSPSFTHADSRRLAEISYDRAVEELAQGDVAAAISGFRDALTADPDFSDATHGLIHALRLAGRLDEAVEVTQALIAAHPDDTLAHTSLSILYQHQGKVPEAEAAALKAKLLGWKQQLREQAAAEGGK
ncbi:Tfp pilus assembly protein PilF [Silvibacterium bohemicum]|uniref:Tfp pilus assembly protein PilF n=1 Tax=Silvibacterium bohemicum TaxID=1577686 RepID=A0A841K5Y9_9BACT|nr:tetratricopeptide repeat protein [Silvibacterium bohemicum]MBB6146551.1 Tfp pilus assembly protein PilF [Silvibacterium bohemicum]